MTAHDRAALIAFNTGTARARHEYAEHPTAFAEFCAACVWPVTSRRCKACQAIMRMRDKRTGRVAS